MIKILITLIMFSTEQFWDGITIVKIANSDVKITTVVFWSWVNGMLQPMAITNIDDDDLKYNYDNSTISLDFIHYDVIFLKEEQEQKTVKILRRNKTKRLIFNFLTLEDGEIVQWPRRPVGNQQLEELLIEDNDDYWMYLEQELRGMNHD